MKLKVIICTGCLLLLGLALIRLAPGTISHSAVNAAIIMPFADLGETRVWDGGRLGLVIVLADAPTQKRAEAVAREIAAGGKVAAIVNVDTFFARVRQQKPDCFDATTLLDVYAQYVQQELHFSHFDKPSLLGLGSAAPYLKLLLAQAPMGVFSAGISVKSASPLLLPAPVCGVLGQSIHWQSSAFPVVLPAMLPQATRWQESYGWFIWQLVFEINRLVSAGSSDVSAPHDDVTHLPLVELPQPAEGSAPFFAVVISGDGGWANIDKDIGDALRQRGVAVVGWNALRYFWEAKTPEVAAQDLANVVRHYREAWGKPRVLLIGFSLGADVMPFMVSRMPADVQASVVGLVLLSPAQSVDFQFHISDWISSNNTSMYQLQPEMEKLARLPVLCIYGNEESDGLCPLLKGKENRQVVGLPGDHHFDGDYAAVVRLALEKFYPQAASAR